MKVFLRKEGDLMEKDGLYITDTPYCDHTHLVIRTKDEHIHIKIEVERRKESPNAPDNH